VRTGTRSSVTEHDHCSHRSRRYELEVTWGDRRHQLLLSTSASCMPAPQGEVSAGWAWSSGQISRACGTIDCMDYRGAGTREPSLPLQRLRTFPPPVRAAAGPSVFPARASRRGASAVAAPQDLRHSRETYPRCGFLTAILELGPCRAFTEMAAVAPPAGKIRTAMPRPPYGSMS